ncbi:MAG: hypothetical protein WAX14_15315 [Rhodococcus sp. (in: high G+C Gram-positive bacteria)]|uniref:hypothetical protein n=1 Tax=Rhodococcus sp. TaxID=1831 RepID=UPI003BB78590
MNRLIIAATGASLLLTGCSGGTADQDPATTTTSATRSVPATTATPAPALSAVPGKALHVGTESECIPAAPASGFGLRRVAVQNGAVGHPTGAKLLWWEFDGTMPDGVVAFTATLTGADGKPITRGVKFIDGAVAANYVFTGARQDNITIPPDLDSGSVGVFVPAAVGNSIGAEFNWSADLEVEGVTVGGCPSR